jgi:hypothetical protein
VLGDERQRVGDGERDQQPLVGGDDEASGSLNVMAPAGMVVPAVPPNVRLWMVPDEATFGGDPASSATVACPMTSLLVPRALSSSIRMVEPDMDGLRAIRNVWLE